jgi:hypothetical protein
MCDGSHCSSLLREAAVLDFASELAARPNLLFFTMAALDFAGKFRVSGPKYNAGGKPGQRRSDPCRGMLLQADAVAIRQGRTASWPVAHTLRARHGETKGTRRKRSQEKVGRYT